MPPTLANPQTWILTQEKILLWMMVLTRITGLLATFPGLGSERFPLQIRVVLGLLLATVITPVVPPSPIKIQNLPALLIIMALEFAIGLLLGSLVTWTLEVVAFAGNLMDTQMGFSFVQFLDPVNAQPTSVSQSLLVQIAVLLLFLTGLHHQMILALVESYRIVPIGNGFPLQGMALINILGELLAKGFQLAFPVVAVLFLMDLVLGISGKFMPQLQLLQLSFPLKIALGILILGFIMRELVPWLQPLLDRVPKLSLRLLGG